MMVKFSFGSGASIFQLCQNNYLDGHSKIMSKEADFRSTPHGLNVQYKTRWGKLADASALLEVDRTSSECLWDIRDFKKSLRDKSIVSLVVSDFSDKIVAFLMYETREDALNILNLVVHPDHRRRGIGRALIQNLKTQLKVQDDDGDKPVALFYDVRETNLDAQLFLRAMGLVAYRVVEGYFQDIYGSDSKISREAAFCFMYNGELQLKPALSSVGA